MSYSTALTVVPTAYSSVGGYGAYGAQVGVGQPFTVTAAGPVVPGCSVGAARVAASPLCNQALVQANPQLYLLSQSPCLVAQVCNGRPYRSYALANSQGANMFLTRGLEVQGCQRTLVAAPLLTNPCPCEAPHAI